MSQWDLVNSDVILVMGSNMAENHPIAFRFVVEAKQRGATIIHVDPRFTRTSALADIYAPIRSGTDIAFLGGIVRYLLENDLWFREYALPYTNLSTIIEDGFQAPEEFDGLFSGWDEEKHSYKMDSWQYEGMVVPTANADHSVEVSDPEKKHEMTKRPPRRDETLQDPNCVYQIMRRRFAAYTPEMVERVTGCPKESFVKIAEAMAKNSGRERTGAVCYALGWTHHTTGSQMIRAATIMQGLLGNMGRPGGGVLALRGHCSIQGSTDIPTLYEMLPTYLAQPKAAKHPTLETYLEEETVPTGWWTNLPKYMVSLLKAWYGEHATKENEFGYQWLPKIVGDHSQFPMTFAMTDGFMRGMFVIGQNTVVGGMNAKLVQKGLAGLDWLVVRDSHEVETATFWKKGTLISEGEMKPEDIATEIFLMPASLPGEKAGTFTNTQRLVQWHDKVVDGPGDSRSDLSFVFHLARRLKELYAESTEKRDEPIRKLTLDYPVIGPLEDPDSEAVLQEINGYTTADRKLVSGFKALKDDGSTACGGWAYSGLFPEEGKNLTRSRKADGPDGNGAHHGWAFAWPSNRRTLYNRASADPEGKPWSERKKMIWWDEAEGKWTGLDIPDYVEDKAPGYRPDWSKEQTGMDAISGSDPFIMMPDGRMALFTPAGLKDGPLPAHYEPVETPAKNAFYKAQSNPAAKRFHRKGNALHEVADKQYPYALTTYRLTEHHTAGAPTRGVPTTAELQPESFAEIPPELAEKLGVRTLDWVVLSTKRGEVETRAMVTERLRPLTIDGSTVYEIGMPWHFGWAGYATGDIANILTSIVADPNVSMHEAKALTCNLRKGRLRRHHEGVEA
ncbi:formate dehydrogenase major subunit [Faunimonas pinastri]|nr:formate dehydrogenase major subunit [Faunimonas pinastri]